MENCWGEDTKQLELPLLWISFFCPFIIGHYQKNPICTLAHFVKIRVFICCRKICGFLFLPHCSSLTFSTLILASLYSAEKCPFGPALVIFLGFWCVLLWSSSQLHITLRPSFFSHDFFLSFFVSEQIACIPQHSFANIEWTWDRGLVLFSVYRWTEENSRLSQFIITRYLL